MDAGTLELVELDTRLDWDHAPKCELLKRPCDAAATVLEINHCCGATYYGCGEHAEQIDLYISSLSAYHCNACQAENPIYSWKPIA